GPAAVAANLGSDVPRAFREISRLPGAGQLATVAAAWHVAHRSGTALGSSIAQVADLLREEAETGRLVAVELAAARVTARMICALPVLVLLFAASVGADPWHFLTATPVGIGCLVVGALLDLLGLLWLQRITDAVTR
ncbi:MAG TPA: type II secretion system F family protein, partial [Marmoricola sp.]